MHSIITFETGWALCWTRTIFESSLSITRANLSAVDIGQIIARVDMDKEVSRWADAVTEYLAVIELKYKMGFAANKDISADYEKLQEYVKTLGVGCKLYMATIWECEDDATAWTEDAEWNQGKVTELNASYVRDSDGIPQFYVVKH